MNNKPDILEVLHRAHTGEYCTAKEWDTRRIPGGVRGMLRKYRLEKTFDPENPINCDDELADTYYQAGYELALELGILCENTDRIIRVSKEELDNALKFAPSELTIGEGADATTLRSRTPTDPYPMKCCASLAITIREDLYPLLTEAIAREREVDVLGSGSLMTIYGKEVRAGTPFETYMGYENGRMLREFCRRAGRPGLGINGLFSATTEYGQFGGYGMPGTLRSTDIACILFPSEMKVDYRTFHKIIHTLNCGGIVKCDSPSMIGGMPGPPEGASVASIACALLSYGILQAQIGGGENYDVRALTNVNRPGLWSLSVIGQALSRNTHLLTHTIANQVSGPCTETLLYEIAAGIATIACAGAAFTTGPRTAGGKLTNHLTPLECRFCAEVSHRASGLPPKTVNGIVKELLPKYEGSITDPDVGLPFEEAYDLKTMRPIEKWEQIYRQVKREVIELGIPLDKY